MKAPKFYPAPWHVGNEDCDVESADNTGICSMYADERANIHAKAIAALPQCLAALEAILALQAGEFDNPALMSMGPLMTQEEDNIEAFCRRALTAAGFTD